MTEPSPPSRQRRIALLLWLLPLWLLLSSGIGMWLYFRRQAEDAQIEQARISTSVSEAGLQGDMAKLLTFVGERHPGSPAGVQGLTRAAAMIEGGLGPANAGYRVDRIPGPATPAGQWPILMVTVRGKDPKAGPLWVVAGYDGRPGTTAAEANASGVASAMAAARALATATPQRTIHFAFLPHAYAPESPVSETQELLSRHAANASGIVVVESTGAAGALLISTRAADHPVLAQAAGLGEIVGAEAICLEDDFDLSSALFERGLPAIRVATRPVVRDEDVDDQVPDPTRHAAATRALVTLIERLSGS